MKSKYFGHFLVVKLCGTCLLLILWATLVVTWRLCEFEWTWLHTSMKKWPDSKTLNFKVSKLFEAPVSVILCNWFRIKKAWGTKLTQIIAIWYFCKGVHWDALFSFQITSCVFFMPEIQTWCENVMCKQAEKNTQILYTECYQPSLSHTIYIYAHNPTSTPSTCSSGVLFYSTSC